MREQHIAFEMSAEIKIYFLRQYLVFLWDKGVPPSFLFVSEAS